MPTPSSIARVLELQRAAYELLLWLGQRAQKDDSILRDENLEKWRFSDSTEAWLRDFEGMMPTALRPAPDDLPSFARLFSSFFSTSFHVSGTTPERAFDDWGAPTVWKQTTRRSLVAGAPSHGKRSAKNKAKIKSNARELERLALEALALQNELFPSRAKLDAILNDSQLEAHTTLWAYFHELERRASFASQGASVHQLWRDLNEGERRNLNAERVWTAYETLRGALRSEC